jgi:ribosomal protein S27AE
MWWLLIYPIIAILAVVFYYFSVQSRKFYRCPQCGEKVRVEHMKASRCGMCGAPLKQEETE